MIKLDIFFIVRSNYLFVNQVLDQRVIDNPGK